MKRSFFCKGRYGSTTAFLPPEKNKQHKRLLQGLVFILVLVLYYGANAQVLMPPKIYFPLDAAHHSGPLIASALPGKIDISAVTDGTYLNAADHRHGVPQGAASFQNADRFKIANQAGTNTATSFFGMNTATGHDVTAFTISCWVYVRPNETTKRYILYGAGAGNNLGLGLCIKGPDLFLIKYINNGTASPGREITTTVIGNSWECSFRGPASFSAGEGWYQVILVQAPYYTKVFVGMPPEQTGGVWVGKKGKFNKDFGGNMVVHGKQDLSSFTKWGLGLPEGMTDEVGVRSSVLKIDDFMVFDYDMMDAQAEALYHCQASGTTESCFGSGQTYTHQFAIIGDYGCDGGISTAPALTNPVEKVANMVKSWTPEYIISVGDDSYTATATCGNTYADNVGKYYGTYIDKTSNVNNKFFPVMGNHDRDCPPGTTLPYTCASGTSSYYRCSCLWEDYFPTEHYAPNYNFSSGLAPNAGRYYSFVKGNIQFFAINSNKEEPDNNRYKDAQGNIYPQAQWLKDALAASTATFKVVYMHHPPYTSKVEGHGGNNAQDTMATWPLKSWGADIVIAGDNHFYERSDYRNLAYVVNGTSGYPGLATATTLMPGAKKHIENEFGAIFVESNDNMMHFQFYSIDPAHAADRSKDRMRDEFWLYKQTPGAIYGPHRLAQPGVLTAAADKAAPVETVAAPVAAAGLTVFPNPTNGELTIRLGREMQGKVVVRILDIAGREVYTRQLQLQKGSRQIFLGNIKAKGVSQGMYFLQVTAGEETKSVKVIVQ